MNTSESIKHSLKIFKLIFYLMIYIHCQACAWFFFTNIDQTWFPLEKILLNNHDFYYDDIPVLYQYCFSVYHSVNILLGEEMLPVTQLQAIILSVMLLLGEFVHAHIMGTIGVVLQSMSRKQTKYQEQIEIASSTMKTIKLSEQVQKQVQDYLQIRQSDIDNQKELEHLLGLLSPSLRLIVTRNVFFNAISVMTAFKNQPEIVDFIVQNIETLQFMPEDFIIRQGQKASQIFFLAQGQCEVLVRDETKKDVFVRDIYPGMMFGEIALVYKIRRTASVRSKDQCTVGVLSEENFEEMCRQFPEVENRLKDEASKYNDPWKACQINLLSNVEYLSKMPYEIIENLHYQLNFEHFEDGSLVFNKDQLCDAILLVVSGNIELYVESSNSEIILDVLPPGSYIGCYSIFN